MLKNDTYLHTVELNRSISLLAVSGGMDSMALWHVFETLKLPYAVAHCNFGLRENESDAETNLIIKIAKERNCTLHFTNFTKLDFDSKLSTQQAARNLRYTYFNTLKTQFNYERIVTAHHAQDNLEHLLIYLSRNNTSIALRGIQNNIKGNYRPLIQTSRPEINAYVNAFNIAYLNDSSNEKTVYLRNKFRHLIVPFLNTDSILNELSTANEVQLILNKKLSLAFFNACTYYNLDVLIIKKTKANESLFTSYLNNANWHAKQVNKIIYLQNGSQITNVDTVVFSTATNWVQVKKQLLPQPVKLPIGTNTLILPYCTLKAISTLTIDIQFYEPNTGQTIKTKIGTKKISKLLTDLKIPSYLKTFVPLLLVDNQIIAVADFAFAKNFKKEAVDVNITWNEFFAKLLAIN